MIHLHRGTWRETLRIGAWADTTTGELQRGRVTIRTRTCTSCGRVDEITTRDGRTWRRHRTPVAWTPPTEDELQQLVALAHAHGWDQ